MILVCILLVINSVASIFCLIILETKNFIKLTIAHYWMVMDIGGVFDNN